MYVRNLPMGKKTQHQPMSSYIKKLCPIHINELCKLFGKKQTQIIEIITPLLRINDRFSFEKGVLIHV